MSVTAAMVLERMLDVTPEPPTDPDPEGLIEAFAVLQAAWQEIMDEVPSPPRVETDAEHALAKELGERQAAWHAALEAARDALGSQRVGVGKLRNYAHAL